LLEALTVQKGNVYKTGPNDRSIYGSIAQEKTEAYESPDSSQASSTRTRTAIAPGGPGQQGVSYVRLEEPQYQEQSNQNQKPGDRGGISYGSYTNQKYNTYITDPNDQSIYGSVTIHKNQEFKSGGSDNQARQNEDQIPTDQGNLRMGSITVQTGNTYDTNPGSKNFFGSVTYQEGNRYLSRPNQQAPNNSSNSTEGQAHAEKLAKPNGQTKLSPNKFCLFLISWIGLAKYCRP